MHGILVTLTSSYLSTHKSFIT